MSGETESNVSGWSVDTLHGHMLTLFEERGRRFDELAARMTEMLDAADRRYAERFNEADKRYEQRFIAQQVAVQDALLAQEKSVSAALVAADRAVLKAEVSSEKRFDAVNEFRATLADQAATLMPRSEAESRFGTMNDKLTELTTTTRDQDDRLRDQHQRDLVASRDEFSKAIAGVSRVQDVSAGQNKGIGQSWGVVLSVLGAAAIVLAFGKDLLGK